MGVLAVIPLVLREEGLGRGGGYAFLICSVFWGHEQDWARILILQCFLGTLVGALSTFLALRVLLVMPSTYLNTDGMKSLRNTDTPSGFEVLVYRLYNHRFGEHYLTGLGASRVIVFKLLLKLLYFLCFQKVFGVWCLVFGQIYAEI